MSAAASPFLAAPARAIPAVVGGRPSSARAVRRAVESLEDRRLFSGTGGAVNWYNNALTLWGPTTSGHSFAVTLSADGKSVTASVDGKNSQTVPLSQLKSIKVIGENYPDSISIDTRLTVPTQLNGAGGNDTISGGGGADMIRGGTGNDSVNGNGGSDIIYGDDGNDTLVGGTGNNYLNGLNGNDSLVGGSGSDVINGGAGTNVAVGGGGNDDITNTTTSNGGSTGSTTYVPSGLAAQITPAASNTIFAGFSYSAAATASGLGAGDPLTATYAWDFGDPGSSYNTLNGFNAGHVYANAGTYTVTLTITNQAGQSTSATTNVTVLSAASMKTIYVSPTGDDKNAGTSSSAPVQSLARAAQLVTDNTRVLFQSGATFDVGAGETLNVGSHQNVYVGTYGSGASPVLRYSGPTSSNFTFITDQTGSKNIAVVGLTFDSVYTSTTDKIGIETITPHGTGFLVQGNTFLNVDDAVNANAQPVGLVVQDNDAPLATGLRGYFVWTQGTDITIIGNTVANSTREHIVRVEGATGVNISDDDFTNLNRQYSGDPKDSSKGTVVLHFGAYAYVADDTVVSGPIGVGPLGGSGGGQQGQTFQYAVVENNTFSGSTFHFVSGSAHTMLRDNIFRDDSGSQVVVEAPDNVFTSRIVSDARIVGNTGIDYGTTGNFLNVAGKASGIVLDDNLYVAPNLIVGGYSTAPVYVSDSALTSFAEIRHNVWPVPAVTSQWIGHDGINYVYTFWSDARGYLTVAEWNALNPVDSDAFANVSLSSTFAPGAGSAAANFGVSVAGLTADMNGKARPSSSLTVGAVQL